jgi:hypothetical protein
MLSTLQRYIEKMGGRLALVAEFPNRKPVKLKGLGEINARRARTKAAGSLVHAMRL